MAIGSTLVAMQAVPARPRAVVSWSSGKDSAYALWETLRAGELQVVGLLTTVSERFGRVSIHGVREELLQAQAAAAGLPLLRVRLPQPCSDVVYAERMAVVIDGLRRQGVSHVVFGDLFLEEIRAYREAQLRATGVTPLFPLWGRATGPLARTMIAEGLQARIVALDPKRIPRELAGRPFDADLLAALPADVDPCGENGEFHTFASGGPMFSGPIGVRRGRVVDRDGFVFADLRPVRSRRSGLGRSV